MEFDIQFFGDTHSGSRHGGRGGGGSSSSGGGSVRGVPQSQIDSLRGDRDHMNIDAQTPDIIKQDYARVGITISDFDAKEIHEALADYSGNDFKAMVEAYALNKQGKALTIAQQNRLRQYMLCEEYCKIAPTYKGSSTEVFRGLKPPKSDSPYYTDFQNLLNAKVGDKVNLSERPTSFTTSSAIGEGFSISSTTLQKGSILLHAPTKSLKNSPSIMGLAANPFEREVLVADYGLKITQRTVDPVTGLIHIYLDF